MNIQELARFMSAIIVIVIGSTVIVTGCSADVADLVEDKVVEKRVVKTEEPASEPEDDKDDIEEEREVSGFTKVSVGGTIKSTIRVGESFRVVLKGKDTVLKDIVTKVEDGRLSVGYRKGYWRGARKSRNERVSATITLPSLEALNISGASQSSVSGVDASEFKVEISGASQVSISGTATDVEVEMSGASTLDAKELATQNATFNLSGASNTKISVSSKLSVVASGASNVQYVGNPQVMKNTSGASSVSQMD